MIKINLTQSRQLQAMMYALSGAVRDLNIMHLPVKRKKEAIDKFQAAIDDLALLYDDCIVDGT